MQDAFADWPRDLNAAARKSVLSIRNVIPDKAAELAIFQAEERFRQVFERSPAGVARVGLDGTWLEVNDRLCDMLGYTFEELAQMRPWDLIHPEDLKRNLEERERLLSGKAQQVSLETRYLRKDGSVIWLARTASLVRDASGTPQYFVSVGQDITDRKQYENRLRHETELFSDATTASRIAIFRWDLRSGKWEWDRTQPVIGLIPEEVLSTVEGILTLVVPEDRAELYERLSRSAKEGRGFDHEFRATLPPQGEVAWIYGRGSIVRDPSGQPRTMTGAFVNMTEYRILRRELQEHKELLLLAESAGEVHSWAVDAIASRKIWWTPASYQLYGRREELGPPTREEFIQLVHPNDQKRVRENFQLLNKSGSDDTFRIEFRTAPVSGKVRWILTKGRVHRDSGGWPLRMVGVDIDITERREAGEALRRLEKLSVLQRLAASIAHEINNPLMAIANELFLITQSTNLEEARKYARLAQEEITRITHYANRTLRFRRRPSLVTSQKVSEIVAGVLNMLKYRYPQVEVTTDFRDRHPLECCGGDVEQLASILLGNAFDAVASGGSVKVRIRERTRIDADPGIQITIADSGQGMSAEVKAHLFEPFFSTKDTTGLGLGLWIASGIVRDLEGRVRIRSSDRKAGHGTSALVFLPFRSAVSSKVTSAPAKAA
jgi:PAS domain S-box-containing protein